MENVQSQGNRFLEVSMTRGTKIFLCPLLWVHYKYEWLLGGIKMNISNKMKEIRAITGLTRKDFSDKYGIPLRTLEE